MIRVIWGYHGGIIDMIKYDLILGSRKQQDMTGDSPEVEDTPELFDCNIKHETPQISEDTGQ